MVAGGGVLGPSVLRQVLLHYNKVFWSLGEKKFDVLPARRNPVFTSLGFSGPHYVSRIIIYSTLRGGRGNKNVF